MSEIGYYRYKTRFSTPGIRRVSFNASGVEKVVHTIEVKEHCENDRYLKYLDSDGQYCFFPFNSYWTQKDKSKEIGRTNKILSNLLTDQSDSNSVGKRNERTLTLIADIVTNEELEQLSDLFNSPRVYLYIGDGTTDFQNDWVEVQVDAKDNTTRIGKGAGKKLTIEVTLPTWYTVTML